MNYIVNAPHLTPPTYETLVDYTKKRFAKIEKLLRRKGESDYEMRVGVEKSGKNYALVAELHGGPIKQVVKATDRDIRKVVDIAADKLKRAIANSEGKVKDMRTKRQKVLDSLRKLARFGG
ncbi:MAG: hypothetical protein Kow0081_3230 [Candidatus Dojkabacteria bacterium]